LHETSSGSLGENTEKERKSERIIFLILCRGTAYGEFLDIGEDVRVYMKGTGAFLPFEFAEALGAPGDRQNNLGSSLSLFYFGLPVCTLTTRAILCEALWFVWLLLLPWQLPDLQRRGLSRRISLPCELSSMQNEKADTGNQGSHVLTFPVVTLIRRLISTSMARNHQLRTRWAIRLWVGAYCSSECICHRLMSISRNRNNRQWHKLDWLPHNCR
jgi:hypothetical protein